MHLLLIHQAFASPREPGGTRHYEFARHMVESGHCCTIIASRISYLTGRSTGDAAGERQAREEAGDRAGLRVLRAYALPAHHRGFAWRVLSFLVFMCTSTLAALRVGPVDLVMGTSPPIFQALSALFVAAVRRRPYLLEIRDLWPEFAIDMGVLRNAFLVAFARRLERFLYARATHILVNSPAYRDYLVGRGVRGDRISLIPNGADPDAFDPEARGDATRRSLKLNHKFVVTYAGALGVANDIPTVLRAAQRLLTEPQIHFLLIGDGKDRPQLELRSQQLGLTNLSFALPRPKSEMPEVLAASDACLAILQDIPMFRCTYPNKVFDYMAAGRPTLLAIDGVIRQVLDAAAGGIFVPPGDDGALAAAAQELSRDPMRAREMGRAARAFVVEHFNRHEQAEQFEQLALNLASTSGGQANA
jgi:glycosyltransferase involved in cell wall biosynthesis